MTDQLKPTQADERPISEHPCWWAGIQKIGHRHHFIGSKLQPDCERCGTEIGKDGKQSEGAPLLWRNERLERQRAHAALHTDEAIAAAARQALGEWLAWPDAGRDGPREVDNEKVRSWLSGLPTTLARLAHSGNAERGEDQLLTDANHHYSSVQLDEIERTQGVSVVDEVLEALDEAARVCFIDRDDHVTKIVEYAGAIEIVESRRAALSASGATIEQETPSTGGVERDLLADHRGLAIETALRDLIEYVGLALDRGPRIHVANRRYLEKGVEAGHAALNLPEPNRRAQLAALTTDQSQAERMRAELADYRKLTAKQVRRITQLEGAIMARPPVKVDDGTWWYPEGDTSSDACCHSPSEALEGAVDQMADGESCVVVIERALQLPDVYAAVHVFTDAEKDARDDDEPWDYTLHATDAEARAALSETQP